jgi:hypothetical protein
MQRELEGGREAKEVNAPEIYHLIGGYKSLLVFLTVLFLEENILRILNI